jgi:hypothetical protein
MSDQFYIQNQRQNGATLILLLLYCLKQAIICPVQSRGGAVAGHRPHRPHIYSFCILLACHITTPPCTPAQVTSGDTRTQWHRTWSGYWGSTHAICREGRHIERTMHWAPQYSVTDHECYLHWLRTVRYILPSSTWVNCVRNDWSEQWQPQPRGFIKRNGTCSVSLLLGQQWQVFAAWNYSYRLHLQFWS